MKERNLWSAKVELKSLGGTVFRELFVSTKTDYEPDALGIIHQVIDKEYGEGWELKEFIKVECLGQVYSIKKL